MKTFLVILTLAVVSTFAAGIASAQQVRASDGTTSKPGHGFVDAPSAVLGTDGGYSGGWGLKRVPATAGASDSMCVVGDNLVIGCFSKANGYSGRVDAGVTARIVTCSSIVFGATDAGVCDSVATCDAGVVLADGDSCATGVPAATTLGNSTVTCRRSGAVNVELRRCCVSKAADCPAIGATTYKATLFGSP